MAIFDSEEKKIIVRVIYDGPGLAGKTTNLQQLCNFFTTYRRSELFSPATINGRTTYLDWLQIDSGLVGGHPLRSHFVTVPGQSVFTRRRSHLLDLADVVVFVVEASSAGLQEAVGMFDWLNNYIEKTERDVPIVVQANKQDLPVALAPEQIRSKLNLAPQIPVVAGQASQGIGVRETAVLAIRAAADRVQNRILRQGLDSLVGVAPDGAELKAQMERLELEKPQSPVEVLLRHRAQDTVLRSSSPSSNEVQITALEATVAEEDEVQSALDAASSPSTLEPQLEVEPAPISEGAPTSEAPPATLQSDDSASEPEPEATESRAPDSRAPESLAPESLPPTTSSRVDAEAVSPISEQAAPTAHAQASEAPLPATEPGPVEAEPASTEEEVTSGEAAESGESEKLVTTAAPPSAPATASVPGIAKSAPPVSLTREGGLPPLPTPAVASGFVWPSTTGRDILKRVPISEAIHHANLAGSKGVQDGSGASDVFVFEAGIWCLKTSRRRCYDDAEEARAALLTLARRKIQLGALLANNTVLSVQQADSKYWLWTVMPWLETLRSSMSHAVSREDEDELGRRLQDFAMTAVQCATMTARSGIALDVHPSNFATVGSKVFYIDDDIASTTAVPMMGHALLRRIDEYEQWPRACECYLETLVVEMNRQLTSEDVAKLQLRESIDAAATSSELAADAKARLLGTINQTLRSAS